MHVLELIVVYFDPISIRILEVELMDSVGADRSSFARVANTFPVLDRHLIEMRDEGIERWDSKC